LASLGLPFGSYPRVQTASGIGRHIYVTFSGALPGNYCKLTQEVGIGEFRYGPSAYIERFNRTFREDILDAYLFSSINEVFKIIEQWFKELNPIRPHEALQGLSPYQYAIDHA